MLGVVVSVIPVTWLELVLGDRPLVPLPLQYSYDEDYKCTSIGKFAGENESEAGEHFTYWIEQFELVASVCHWYDHTKLVNLTTRLRDQAFAFYQSCSTQQRNDYTTLVSEPKKCFTPACLQDVQSSLFHDRKQKSNESVDAYAQEIQPYFTVPTLRPSKQHRKQNKWPIQC